MTHFDDDLTHIHVVISPYGKQTVAWRHPRRAHLSVTLPEQYGEQTIDSYTLYTGIWFVFSVC